MFAFLAQTLVKGAVSFFSSSLGSGFGGAITYAIRFTTSENFREKERRKQENEEKRVEEETKFYARYNAIIDDDQYKKELADLIVNNPSWREGFEKENGYIITEKILDDPKLCRITLKRFKEYIKEYEKINEQSSNSDSKASS